MKTTLAIVAALLLAGTYLPSAHAQTAPQSQQSGTTGQIQTYRMTGQTQAQPHGTTGGQARMQPTQGQLPNGSYQSSCKDVRMDGQTLIGFCQKPDGTWRTSALRTSQCAGDIRNINGELSCGAEIGSGSSTPPASGQQR
jgi:hypothetical protein